MSSVAGERETRADALIAEARRTLREHPARRATRPAARRPAAQDFPRYGYALLDLKASADGRRLGRQYGHNPDRLARALGAQVLHIPLSQLQNRDRPRVMITGQIFWLRGCPVISIAEGLTPHEDRRVLGHELAHHLDSGFDERLCNQFSDAFLKIEDDEVRGFEWRRIQEEQLQAARRRARR